MEITFIIVSNAIFLFYWVKGLSLALFLKVMLKLQMRRTATIINIDKNTDLTTFRADLPGASAKKSIS